jgi:putative ABC transport system permease protein
MRLTTIAYKNLRRHRARTLLTVLGIAISAILLFAIFAFNQGYDAALEEELRSSGVQMFVSMEGCPLQAASLIMHGGEIPSYLEEQMLPTIQHAKGVKEAGGMLISTVISSGKADLFYGVTDEVRKLKPNWRLKGRWFDCDCEKAVILGSDLAKDYKKKPGDKIKINSLNKTFLVAGVLKKTGTEDDGFFFLPLKTQQEIFGKEKKLTAIGVQVDDITRIAQTKKELEKMGAYVVPEAEISELVGDVVGGTKALMVAILVIVLIVAGLGVFNTVMMATFERKQEFGYLRCVGARRRDIFSLIVIETLLICAAGLVVGLGLGFFASLGLDRWIRGFLPYVPAGRLLRPNIVTVAISAAVILVLGVIAGIYPGFRASKVAPIEAVRHE